MYSIPTENVLINLKDRNGETALHRAARANDVTQITSLLSLGANVNARNNSHKTPLHSAAVGNSLDSHFFTIEALLKNGVDINAQDGCGQTALHKLKNASVWLVRLFLNYNASVSVKDNTGSSFMCNVFILKRDDIARLLVNHHFNYVRAADNFGISFLHWAFYFQNLDVIRLILKQDYASINAVDDFGRTPVDLLFMNFFDCKTLEFLLKYFSVESFISEGSCILTDDYLTQKLWKIILKHVAEIRALDLTVESSLMERIFNKIKFKEYFEECAQELSTAKNCKLENSWITYFDLLVDNKRKLKNYAGNQDLIRDFETSDLDEKFPIYGAAMQKKVAKGIRRRKLFDKSSTVFSNYVPVFSPNHLIVRDVLDFTSTKELKMLCGMN